MAHTDAPKIEKNDSNMATIYVVEDDASTLLLIVSALEKLGHRVVTSGNGRTALGQIPEITPDLLITDINVPGLDGYTLVRELRANPLFAALPVIMLSSMAQRANVRIGMTAGADDYITKPFSLAELREAVDAQLRRKTQLQGAQTEAIKTAVEDLREELAVTYEQRLQAAVNRMWSETEAGKTTEALEATVLYAGMKHFLRYAEALTQEQLADFVHRYYQTCVDTVELFGVSALQFYGEGMLAVFTAENDTLSVTHQLRAWRAAQGLLNASNRLKTSFDKRLYRLGLPLFETSVSMHEGVVQMVRVDGLTGKAAAAVPVGDPVNVVKEINKKQSGLWQISASKLVADKLTEVARQGQKAVISTPPRLDPLAVCELVAIPVNQ
jgi:DNA-binding response OmpR family regulator